jgi:sugar phosphate permease
MKPQVMSQSRKTTNRYVVFVMLYLGWCVSYVDRVAINLSLASISKDMHLAPAAMGLVLSSFFIAYMQLPGGWLADKYGSKKVIMLTLILWSAFTVFTGFAWSLVSLIVIRFLFGIGEGAFPCASFKGIPEYFPRAERPRMISLLVSSNYTGSAIAPLLVAPLMLLFGWRNMFYIIGIVGCAYVLVYWVLVRPPAVQEETAKTRTGQQVSVKELFRMPLMWQLVIAWFGLSLVNKGLDSWMPTYLLTVRHLDLKTVGVYTSIPFIAAGISTAIGGWVMDKFFDKKEKYLLILAGSMSVVFLYLMYASKDVGMFVLFESLLYFFKTLVLASVLALPLKLLPGNIVGTATGIINTGGQAAGFVSPAIMGLMIGIFHGSYNAAFWFLIGAACLSVAASLTINSSGRVQLAGGTS